MDFKMKGMDEFKKKMKDLENNPQELFVGKTLELQKEVKCEHCGESFKTAVPVKVQRVVGKTGYGPRVSIRPTCTHCGKINDYTWNEVSFKF